MIVKAKEVWNSISFIQITLGLVVRQEEDHHNQKGTSSLNQYFNWDKIIRNLCQDRGGALFTLNRLKLGVGFQ